MAESKKNRNIDEDILRYIFESRFFPERLIDKESEYANNLSYIDEDLFKLMDGAKSYTEARNLLIEGLKDEANLARAREAARAYSSAYGNPNEPFDSDKAFLTPMDRIPLNVERLPYDVVESRANDIARALLYTNGVAGMIADMNNRNKITNMLGEKSGEEYRQHIAKEIMQRLNDEKLDKSVLLDSLDLTPNADDNYIANKASEYAERVNRKLLHEKMGGGSKLAYSFMQPYSHETESEGLKPSAIDAIFDFATMSGSPLVGAKISRMANGSKRLEKAAEKAARQRDLDKFKDTFITLSGIGAVAGAIEPIVTRAHDGLDALLSKSVYAHEGDDNEVSERGDVWKALRLEELPSDVKNGVLNGFMTSAVGLGGRGGGLVFRKLGDKIASSNVGKKALNGLDALFGGKAKKAHGDLMKEKKEIQDRIDNYWTKSKSTVSDEALRQYNKRLNQIERHQGSFEKAYDKAAQNFGKTAYDALVYSALVKAGLNPEMNAKNLAKEFYNIELLKGR